MTGLCIYAPLDGWLRLLAEGWSLPWIVEPMARHHGRYAVLMCKEDGE